MTEPVCRKCGEAVHEIFLIDDIKTEKIKRIAYYCITCNTIFTDTNMIIVNLNDEEVHLDYLRLGSALKREIFEPDAFKAYNIHGDIHYECNKCGKMFCGDDYEWAFHKCNE